MKRLSSLLIFSGLIFFSSCEKEETVIDPPKEVDPVIVTINGVDYDSLSGYTADSTQFIDFRDSNVYSVVTIGTQRWMGENLRFDVQGCWIHPSRPSEAYGLLYTWDMLMAGATSSDAVPSGVQGLCPSGWHIPSDEEWKILEMHLGMSLLATDSTGSRGTDQGPQLKSLTGWADNGNGTNSSSFNALPAGSLSVGGSGWNPGGFSDIGYSAVFWSSTRWSSTSALYRYIDYLNPKIARYGTFTDKEGYACRCLKD